VLRKRFIRRTRTVVTKKCKYDVDYRTSSTNRPAYCHKTDTTDDAPSCCLRAKIDQTLSTAVVFRENKPDSVLSEQIFRRCLYFVISVITSARVNHRHYLPVIRRYRGDAYIFIVANLSAALDNTDNIASRRSYRLTVKPFIDRLFARAERCFFRSF